MNPSQRAWGVAFALVGVIAFSFRPILIKLAYAAHPIGPVTLLFLRMMLALPFFLAMAWWLRNATPRLTARDWAGVVGLGFIGYYLASFFDFLGRLNQSIENCSMPPMESIEIPNRNCPINSDGKFSYVAINLSHTLQYPQITEEF